MKPLFVKQSTLGLRLGLVLLVVVALIVADLHFNAMRGARAALETAATPVYWVAELPMRALEWSREHMVSRATLLEDNARLNQENLVLQGRSQQMASLQAENVRLRALLNSSAMLRDDVLVAELVGVSPDPERHQLVLNKGSRDGVFLGQPLLDADGLLGQIVEVAPGMSRALLVTDATHSIPVQVNRNGVRAIAEGTGSLSSLAIYHVSATTDIREGDLLVTSGLGGRFPAGYPVAVVDSVHRDPGQTFARVTATPTAALDRSRHVLLVFTAKPAEEG
ncbi:rod shape-determining protein MreC [Mangrovimicrobium sediminis]|uniref:Cell shape-determining protein MreC n=1 Tax=Mangrovimicrobium sediminis TaxID=2562682 RepID=A0A4Z0LXM8_9GAMM|nr:rod shape-determining protein MreC [Haliea sp. SAOS-164]TGD72092.1 rod shape-determining protein MreC [Haliea sp. SAOS-164]